MSWIYEWEGVCADGQACNLVDVSIAVPDIYSPGTTFDCPGSAFGCFHIPQITTVVHYRDGFLGYSGLSTDTYGTPLDGWAGDIVFPSASVTGLVAVYGNAGGEDNFVDIGNTGHSNFMPTLDPSSFIVSFARPVNGDPCLLGDPNPDCRAHGTVSAWTSVEAPIKVPEPSALALLLLGVALAMIATRRMRRVR